MTEIVTPPDPDEEPPADFHLEAEAARQDEAAGSGMTEREVALEVPDELLDADDEGGDADDDDAVEEPDAPEEDV